MEVVRTIKSGRVIFINSVLMLVFIVSLFASNLFFLERNNSTQANIDKTFNRKLDVITHMSKIVRERSLLILTMHLSQDPWKQDELFIAFHKLRPVFLKLHSELKSLRLMDNEKALFDKVNIVINKTERIQINIVERIQSGGDHKVHSDISEEDLPLEYEVLGYFDSLAEVIRSNVNTARIEAKEQYRESVILVAIVSLIACLGVIVLMRRLIYQVNKIESSLINEAETLSWDATHDALTNVYNRRWLQHKLESLLEDNRNSTIKHSLLYIDLDEFKPVNDNYGHVAGDHFLCGITRELEKCIRHDDMLARIGGDEFAILLQNCDVEKAKEIADCLVKRVNKFSILVEGKQVHIMGCSVGIREFNSSGITFSQLIKEADSACYAAKKQGKNQSYVYAGSLEK